MQKNTLVYYNNMETGICAINPETGQIIWSLVDEDYQSKPYLTRSTDNNRLYVVKRKNYFNELDVTNGNDLTKLYVREKHGYNTRIKYAAYRNNKLAFLQSMQLPKPENFQSGDSTKPNFWISSMAHHRIIAYDLFANNKIWTSLLDKDFDLKTDPMEEFDTLSFWQEQILVPSSYGRIRAIDWRTGAALWSLQVTPSSARDLASNSTVSSPIIDNSFFIVTSEDGSCYAYDSVWSRCK